MKKLLSTALATALVASAPLAIATELTTDAVTPVSDDAIVQPYQTGNYKINGQSINIWALNHLSLVKKVGVVTVETGESTRITLADKDDKDNILVLNTSDTTRVLDAATGEPKAISDLKTGDSITVYVSPAMAMSMPPQSFAELIITGVSETVSAPTYSEIDSITKSEDGKTVTLKTDSGASILLDEKTNVTPFLTRQALTKDSLMPGQMVLVFAGAKAEDAAVKVLAFNTTYTGIIELADKADSAYGEVKINGETIAFEAPATPSIHDEDYVLPLRKVAETLGYKVEWDSATKTVMIQTSDGTEYAKINTETQALTILIGDATSAMNETTVFVTNGVTMMNINEVISMFNLKFAH